MKTLYLLRHAKSDWSSPELDDFDRPLAPRGAKAAARMGAALRDMGLVPDRVLCSAARRARETWDLLGPALEADVPVKMLRSLYLAAPSRLLGALRRLPDDLPSVMIVGHNPGLAHLAHRLCGPGSKSKALARLRGKYPTAALAVIDFAEGRWRDIGDGRGRLVRFLRPRDLKKGD